MMQKLKEAFTVVGISGGILFLLILLFTIIVILIPTIKEQKEWEKANKRG